MVGGVCILANQCVKPKITLPHQEHIESVTAVTYLNGLKAPGVNKKVPLVFQHLRI